MRRVQRTLSHPRPLCVLSAVCGLLTIGSAHAALPHLIRYQGQVADNQGVPLEGPYPLTFRLYDAETSGTVLWEETQPNIVLSAGHFTVLLGQISPFPATLNWSQPLWLAIQVGAEPEFAPRQRITSVPLAIRAEVAERLEGALATVGSNVGIGTTEPSSALHVTSGDQVIGRFERSTSSKVALGLLSENDTHAGLISSKGLVFRTNWDKGPSSEQFTLGMAIDPSGRVGIGTASPQAKLEVVGTVKIADGTQGPGKVLTSDANGTANWQPPPVGVPSGAIILWDGGSCPAGYADVSPTYAGLLKIGPSVATPTAAGTSELPAHTHNGPSHTHPHSPHGHAFQWRAEGTYGPGTNYLLMTGTGRTNTAPDVNVGPGDAVVSTTTSEGASGTGSTGSAGSANYAQLKACKKT